MSAIISEVAALDPSTALRVARALLDSPDEEFAEIVAAFSVDLDSVLRRERFERRTPLGVRLGGTDPDFHLEDRVGSRGPERADILGNSSFHGSELLLTALSELHGRILHGFGETLCDDVTAAAHHDSSTRGGRPESVTLHITVEVDGRGCGDSCTCARGGAK